MNPKEREFLTAADLQDLLGLSRSGVYNLLNSKDFPAFRVGDRAIRVRRESLYAWIEAQEAKGVR